MADSLVCSAGSYRAITMAQLRAIAPHAPDSALDPLNAAMAHWGISTSRRQAAFLAQVMFECNQGRDLVEPGDGPRFRGRGAIQLTGRTNYTRAAGVLGVDLVAHPEWAADLRWAYEIAGLYWTWHDLNDAADDGDMEHITRAINGGLHGYQVRMEFYARAARALGCAEESGGARPGQR